jgi:hypothetical protein
MPTAIAFLEYTVARPTCTGSTDAPHPEFDMWNDGWSDPTDGPGYKSMRSFHCRRCGRKLIVGLTTSQFEPPPGWIREV